MTLKVIDGRAYLLRNDLETYRNLLAENTKRRKCRIIAELLYVTTKRWDNEK